MKNFSILLFLLPIFSHVHSVFALEMNPKGCQFGLTHTVNGRTLAMTSGEYGECYDNPTVATQVFFGNGDQMSWTTTTSPATYFYTYPEAGNYTAEVWTNGYHKFDFDVHINSGIECDSNITCAPSFSSQLFYSEQKHNYSLVAIRTDTCGDESSYWQVGGIKIVADTLRWPFGGIEEGSLINVCLHMILLCYDSTIADTSSCIQFPINQQNATLTDPIPDSTQELLVYPTFFHNQLQLVVKNVHSEIRLSIFSSEGKNQFSKELTAAEAESIITINTEDFPRGIYFVKSIDENRIYPVQKIVKQ